MGRKTAEDYHKLAKSRRFKWLGPEVANTGISTQWECNEKHRWLATYDNIRQGTNCPECSKRARRKSSGDYHALAKKRGFKWLGPEVTSVGSKTEWECEKGHRWETSYNKIQQGTGCPHCAGNIRKTAKDYHALAKGRGFRWVASEFPSNTMTKTTWKCEENHSWEAGYDNIRAGSGCPHCAGLVPKTVKDYHLLAKRRGFRWVGPRVPNVSTKTTWECSKGHRWGNNYQHIREGIGCPQCYDMVNGQHVSEPQRQICEMLNGILNFRFGRKRIDVALPDEMIAIEYDSWYWHGDRKDYDRERDEDLIAAGWKVLHIKSNMKLPTKRKMNKSLDLLRNGEDLIEIILDDWGQGPTFSETRT